MRNENGFRFLDPSFGFLRKIEPMRLYEIEILEIFFVWDDNLHGIAVPIVKYGFGYRCCRTHS